MGDAVLENIDSTKLCLVLPGFVLFVKKSDRLNSHGIHPTQRTPADMVVMPSCGTLDVKKLIILILKFYESSTKMDHCSYHNLF